MTKLVKRIQTKFAKPAREVPLPDLSIWTKDADGNPLTPVYIETEYMIAQSNKFRSDYRKVIMCISNVLDGKHVPACRKLYKAFVGKWELDTFNPNSRSQDKDHDDLLKMTICGYIENILQQLETQYSIMPTPSDEDVVVMGIKTKNQKPKDSSM